MSGTAKPDAPPPEQPDVPGPLPELPSLDPVRSPSDENGTDDEPSGADVPFIQPGTQ
jgi:hypothetical protein